MKKIPPLTKKRRSLAEISPDSLAAALYHRQLVEQKEQGSAKDLVVQNGENQAKPVDISSSG